MSEKAPMEGYLKHKAILSTVDYRYNDGPYVARSTDVRALSLGRATWDNDEMSAKVWRYVNAKKKWSRESEDVPMHRVLDLTILILSALLQKDGEYENHFLDLVVMNPEALEDLQKYLTSQKPHLDERFNEIQLLLKKYLSPA